MDSMFLGSANLTVSRLSLVIENHGSWGAAWVQGFYLMVERADWTPSLRADMSSLTEPCGADPHNVCLLIDRRVISRVTRFTVGTPEGREEPGLLSRSEAFGQWSSGDWQTQN
jgi:hypothetical protein